MTFTYPVRLQGPPINGDIEVWDGTIGQWALTQQFIGNNPSTVLYSVTSFGAVGNGTTDDTLAIQNTINAASAAGGGTVISGPLTYLLASSPAVGPGGAPFALSLPSNVLLQMNPAATLKIANGLNAGVVLMAAGGTNINFGHFTIDGNKANQVDQGVDGGQCGIYGNGITYFDLGNVTCQNNIRQGIYINASEFGGGRYKVIGNGTVANQCSGFEDDGNTDCDFLGYAINNLGAGLRVVGGSSLQDLHVVSHGGAFYGNLYGIWGVFAQGSQLVAPICQSNTQDGILLQNCDAVGIHGGYYDKNVREGIFVDVCTNTVINSPICRDNNFGATLGAVGILLESASRTVISNARCYDDQGIKSQEYGIMIDSASSHTNIVGGDLSGNSNSAINDSGISTTTFGVILT